VSEDYLESYRLKGMTHPRFVRRLLWGLMLLGALLTSADAHRSGCHRWHSCPSDHGTYTCGDLGYCSQCPDNAYCQAGHPRAAAQQTPTPATPPAPTPSTTPAPAPASIAKVTRVIDGDTLQISTGEKVRLIGVDTPETKDPRKPVQPFGQEASAFTKQLVEGQEVRLEFDVQRQDKYGRTLAYVYVRDKMLNAELVRQGFAQVATYPPNVRYQERFRQLQREAREARRGLWGP
jgi:micrococcal nuclease